MRHGSASIIQSVGESGVVGDGFLQEFQQRRAICIFVRGGAGGAGLAFTVVVRETPKRCLEVSSRLLLDLVCEWMDLESIQSVENRT